MNNTNYTVKAHLNLLNSVGKELIVDTNASCILYLLHLGDINILVENKTGFTKFI